MPSYNQLYIHLKLSAAVKSNILIGITIAFLVFMSYANVGVWVLSNPFHNSYYLPWGFVSILLEVIGFVALSLLLRERKREKNKRDIHTQVGSMQADGQPKNKELSIPPTPPTKENESDYSLDDSKLK